VWQGYSSKGKNINLMAISAVIGKPYRLRLCSKGIPNRVKTLLTI
jgi:hypothetical protein